MFRLLKRARYRYLVLTCLLAVVCLILFYQGLNPADGRAYGFGLSRFKLPSSDPHGPPPVPAPESMRKAEEAEKHGSLWPWTALWGKTTEQKPQQDTCPLLKPLRDVNISTPDVYPTLNFKPSFMSYWNQTFERRYLKRREHWDKLPLKVIVLPHSHNDPGWLKTFDGYFYSSTAHILNNMVQKLQEHPDMTFIWAETSYFAKWWHSLQNRPHLREAVRELVVKGQLELVTGGWVMTDEAVAHYYSMLDQLIEGHQWLKTILGVVPFNGWSIDPFGHSSTMPYLLKKSGIYNTVIQRTHFAWKQYLAEKESFEFYWKQAFDGMLRFKNESSGILCHMAPFDLYSIKHTCGPDTDTCLQFDFRRIAGEYSESRAVQITDLNVKEKAELLIGQYGRVASLFPHNVALIPLGDDFRFNHDAEWDQQYKNYKKIFDYVNAQKDWHVQVQFGTLSDYFNEVYKRMAVVGNQYATLVGDFFAYGDIYAEGRPSYWTGYYTTRPFWKHLCRELEHWLRSAEILYSLANNIVRQKNIPKLQERLEQDYVYLSIARDSLGLFQHHDAITGTSKEMVMHDYGMRLFRGIQEAMGVISHAVQYLMLEQPVIKPADLRPAHPLTSYLFPDVERSNYDHIPSKVPISISSVEGRKIVIFNSMPHKRQEAVRVNVRSPYVRVIDPSNREVPVQVNPLWNGTAKIASGVFEVLFIVELKPLSLSTFILEVDSRKRISFQSAVSIFVDDATATQPSDSIFRFHNHYTSDIEISSPHLTATFSKNSGLLESLYLKSEKIKNKVNIMFQGYKSADFHSGAYLFQPDPLDPVQNVSGRFPVIRVIQGPLMSEVSAVYAGIVSHTCRIYHTDGPLGGGLEMETVFDLSLRTEANLELFMRIDTDIQNVNVFYTDANGFQMMRRVTDLRLPVEANYYPITSSAYIEDFRSRLTLLTSHAHGSASLQNGWLEVMLDRRLRYDDSRGLAEGVLDNKRTKANFWLILEARTGDSLDNEIPNLSPLSHTLSYTLLYPSVLLVTDGGEDRPLRQSLSFLEEPYSCDVHLVTLRTLPDAENFTIPSTHSLLVLHSQGSTCKVKTHVASSSCDMRNATSLFRQVSSFKNVKVRQIQQSSLTGSRTFSQVGSFADIKVPPMQLEAFNVTFAR